MTSALSTKLNASELVERALDQVPSTEPPEFLAGLEVLVDALNEEARLSLTGVRLVANQLTSSLVTQLRMRSLDVSATPIDRPVIVTCLPRMGSTWLHNLLTALPGVHGPRTWELNTPEACAGPVSREAALARAKTVTSEHDRLAPDFAAIHPVTADGPEECHRLLSHAFLSRVFASRCHVPSYLEWLREQDLRPAYGFHRQMLQSIAAGRPGSRLVLKCPFHVWHLAELAATYPDARLVVLHRDPNAALASICRMASVLRKVRSDDVRATEIGRHWRSEYVEGLRHAANAESTGLAVLHVRYDDLVADTAGVLRQIGEFAQLDVPSDFVPPVKFGGSSGKSRVNLADYGIEPL